MFGFGTDCSLECQSWVKEILGKRAGNEKGEGKKVP